MDNESRFPGFRGGLGGASLAVGVWLLSQLSGCSASADRNNCASTCGDLCKALSACDVEVPSDCKDQCTKGVSGADCSASRPPDQLTCAELKDTYACADYCATLCTRAPSCGSFDANLCAHGCTTQSPSICNAASVAARTCDQLKPELRLYEDTARAEQNGSHISVRIGSGTNPYGLCTKADECALPLGCVLETNTCSPCGSDTDCKHGYGSYICSTDNQCLKVACASDEDCFGRVCDVAQHECVDCREDADCTGFYRACNTATAKCAECTSNAHCKLASEPVCDVANSSCEPA
ncbi:MAG TPA: hypothetical protein VJV79_29850 [Polyangiaceae bacterium]|nr:hypothetical protein [Polyangiaceae bacterium]